MRIIEFFKKQEKAYVSIDTEGAWRRDAEPFVAFDTNVPRVAPLPDVPQFEIFERDIVRELAEKVYEPVKEEPALDYEKIIAKCEPETPVATQIWKFKEMDALLLPAPKAQKLLVAGKQPLLLDMPDELETVIGEVLEAQHVVYFSDIEFRDGAEIVTEAKVKRENKRNFIGAKFAALFLMIMGAASVLFPPASLNASKLELNVNPTNTTPGLSFGISSNDMVVFTDPATNEDAGALNVITRPNVLTTTTLDLDVATTGADGYKLYVTTSGTDKKNDYTNALVNKDINTANGEGAKINALTGDTAMSAFPAGYWGYTTESSLQNNTLFKAFPTYDSTDAVKHGGTEIASANTAIADNDSAGETPLTIGVKADNTLPAGDYRNDLLFTVIANPVTVTYNLMFDANATDSSLAGMPATVTASSADVFRNLTIPNAEPTRDEYIFLGWADSPSATEPDYIYGDATKGEVTLQVTDINSSQTVNKTVYAVWKEKDWMQDFDADTELPHVGDTKTLYDKRDGTIYTVKRLADGNVWMTQNLKLNGARTLTSADSDVTSNFSMPASIPYSSWCSGNDCSNTAQVYYDGTRETYGPLYSWAAATAGTGTNAITSGNAISSICPKGWRLPTGGTGGEYSALDIALGGDGTNRSNVPADLAVYESVAGFDYPGAINSTLTVVGEYGRWWSSTAGNSSSAYYMYLDARDDRKVVYPYMSNAKYFGGSVRCIARSSANDNTKYMQDFNDAIDLRTVGNATTYVDRRDGKNYTVARLADGKVWMTQNIDYETGASQRNNYGAYYLRENADNICPTGWHLPSTAEFKNLDTSYGGLGSGRNANSATYSVYTSLPVNWVFSGFYRTVDTQYGKTGWDSIGVHGVYLAADTNTIHPGNVMAASILSDSNTTWMDNPNMGKTYASPIRCVGDQPNVFYIQDFDESSMLPNNGDSAVLTDKRDQKTYTVARLNDGKVWMTQNLAYETGATGVSSTYGVYYSWNTAQTVCPVGWHLPSSSEYATMYTNYSSVSAFTTGGPKLNYGGRRIVSTGNYQYTGSAGYYWDSTNEDEAFSFNNNGQVWTTYTYLSTSYSNQVRCIADEDAKVSFNANGGTGTMATQSFTRGVRQAISTNTFTRDGYEFVGWALTSGASTAEYTDGQSVTFGKATTLYAVWRISYLQDFDATTTILNVGETRTLMDNRDNEVYTVKRLPDGKVWMTQNLRYATGAYTVSSNTEYGAWYSWNTAQSVCPSGWHLPTGGDDGEFVALDKSYGYSGAWRRDQSAGTLAQINNYTSTTGNWPGIVLAGHYSSGSLYRQGYTALLWTSTRDASSQSSTFHINTSLPDNLIYPSYFFTDVNVNGSVRCVANEQETVSFDANGGSGTMADVTVEKGTKVTLTNSFTNPAYDFVGWATSAGGTAVYTDGQAISVNEDITLYALWTPKGDFIQDFDQDTELITVGSTKTLYDKRDGKTYTIKRLADGKVWMTQNLSLGDASESITLTNEDSAISGSSWTLPAQTSGAFSTANYNTVNYRVNSTYGNYYNWYTATAGTGTSSMTSGNAAGSICPKGWHLPTGGTNGETAKLYSAYGNNANSLITAFNPTYAGYNNSTASNDVYYMTSTVADTDNPYVLHMYSGYVNPNNSLRVYKYYGFSMRCVADYSENTISFNANGGTGTMTSKAVVNGQTTTLPANTFTRSGYNFLGWATSAGTNTVTYTDGQNITPTGDMTLYAVWYKPMANFSCTSISMGSSIQLYDERDGNFYNVTRVPSGNGDFVGKCFMNEDLRYGDTFASTHNTGDTFDGMRFVKASEDSAWTGNTQDMSNKQFTIANVNGANVGYYSFPTVSSICPAGWSVPTQQQYSSLITTYGSGTAGINALTSASGPFKLNRNGVFYKGGASGWLSNTFNYWTSSPSQSYAYYFRIGRSGTMEVGSDGSRDVGHPIRCMK